MAGLMFDSISAYLHIYPIFRSGMKRFKEKYKEKKFPGVHFEKQ